MLKCINCLYWQPKLEEDDRGLGPGICRRHAPRPIRGKIEPAERFEEDYEPLWPLTWSSDGCGDGCLRG
jgi:hypothetical protein